MCLPGGGPWPPRERDRRDAVWGTDGGGQSRLPVSRVMGSSAEQGAQAGLTEWGFYL